MCSEDLREIIWVRPHVTKKAMTADVQQDIQGRAKHLSRYFKKWEEKWTITLVGDLNAKTNGVQTGCKVNRRCDWNE